ncbi:TetR/AcrR family transcriptional regulator [Microbacterium murale]|uniref:AcrR family transcriptional regulator n=1 Tax=Microbacterium murale TaxID=1081040 RepID=A0ABU0PAE3_9MICO|nr:TetR/AcrR family transcriptional regulator [Microbacterium murale]MDQ0643897.1 AcrR family transcriptional regulator [Microbacterium murale]
MTREDATADLASVRDAIRASTDRRPAATRSRLYEAVRTLATTDAEITVKSVAEAAGISRATFYTHFSGIDDLALHLQELTFHEISQHTSAASSRVDTSLMEQSQRALIAHYGTYRSLYARVFTIATPRGAESRVVEIMRTEILAHIVEGTRPPADLDPTIAATYIAHAAVGLIVDWVLGDVTATQDELAHHLTQLMPAWMHISVPSVPAGDPDGQRPEGENK